MGILDVTFYNLYKKYFMLGTSEVHRLRQLEEENVKSKRFVADLIPNKTTLQDVLPRRSKDRTEVHVSR